jgi:hypothetical protein
VVRKSKEKTLEDVLSELVEIKEIISDYEQSLLDVKKSMKDCEKILIKELNLKKGLFSGIRKFFTTK